MLVQSARPTWAAPSTPRAYAERAAEPIDLAQTFADLDLDAPDYILFDEEGTTYCFDPDVLEQERQSRLDTPVQERSASDSFYGLAH